MNKARLRKFQNLLQGQLEVLEQHSAGTVTEMTQHDEAALRPDPSDRATVESDRNFDLRLRDRDRKLIAKIQQALARIDQGTYGLCDDCGAPIEAKRLQARPVTTQCLECKQEQERLERRE